MTDSLTKAAQAALEILPQTHPVSGRLRAALAAQQAEPSLRDQHKVFADWWLAQPVSIYREPPENIAWAAWKIAAAQPQQAAGAAALVAERDLAVHEQDVAQESLRQHQVWLQDAQAERDALRQDVQRLSEALRQEIDPPTFMGEPVSLLRKPVKSIADIKECYCPQDKCQAPVIMGRQTPCIRKMKEQK